MCLYIRMSRALPTHIKQITLARHPQATLCIEDMAVEKVDYRPAAKKGSRNMLCGLMQHYQDDCPLIFDHFRLVLRNSIRVLPFSIYDHTDKIATATEALLTAWRAGDLKTEYTLSKGFEAVPRALIALFEGQGRGKRLVQVDEI